MHNVAVFSTLSTIEFYYYEHLPKVKKIEVEDDHAAATLPKTHEYKNSEYIQAYNDRITKFRLIRKINNNFTSNSSFFTLTYAENFQDNNEAKKHFEEFNRSVRRAARAGSVKIDPNYKYVAVIEYQKRGAIHFHMLINSPWLDVKGLKRYWKYGMIRNESVKLQEKNKNKGVDNVGAYLTKYVTKFERQQKYLNLYSCSKNLNDPKKMYLYGEDSEIVKKLIYKYRDAPRVIINEYMSEFHGLIRYEQINIHRGLTGGSNSSMASHNHNSILLLD